MNKKILFITLQKSKAKNKKYKAIIRFNNNQQKSIGFGDNRYEDFTIHKDEERKRLYKIRHQNDNLNDPLSPGYWSYWLLWNQPTINESIKDIENKLKVKIVNFIN